MMPIERDKGGVMAGRLPVADPAAEAVRLGLDPSLLESDAEVRGLVRGMLFDLPMAGLLWFTVVQAVRWVVGW